KPIKGTIIEPPALKTPDDLTHMPPLQALHILRLQLKMGSILGNLTALALWPTALQRLIPHDVRIDYIPSAYLRDRMILFQEFYDLDDCFQLLTTETLFLGGDIRDNRNWVMPKSFTDKFWFFSHELVD
ncbi:uncharacterized protein BYT42DRAFT_485564, partial [Radiomyces spectabilis]|uniref:uncharacterized protein n=1 Tax=Radiomyces spectabilis TaxID=64574 RepID=UPI00221E9AF5